MHGNMIFSSNFLKRWSFQKGLCRHMIFLVLFGKLVFFSRKHDIFSLGRKWKTVFIRKYMETWCIALQRRKTGNIKYRIEVWLLLKFIRLEIFYKRIFLNTLYHSTLRSCVWRCAWAPIKEIISPLGDRLLFQKCKSSSKNFLE